MVVRWLTSASAMRRPETARAHLDLASTDAGLVVADHQRLGACVTDRDPTTGTVTG
jgi:hypothetical protein